ncbi:MAG: YfcE family phosphodiesterase [Dehalococcoidia bacterium]|nr:YfcE family phosphodiesterase [Dehalococcoidia bacterium]
MKIGLIADTHIPSMGKEPPPQVARAFEGVDLILHCGDIWLPSCLDWLERIAPVRAVESGPAFHLVGDSRVVREKRVLEVEGHAIGMIHELAVPGMIQDEVRPGAIAERFPPDASLPAALQEVFGSPVDIVVCGYTHWAMIEAHQGVLLVNPGSPVVRIQRQVLGTVAILEVTPGKREARVVELPELS